jgi:hypothetical protein
MYQLILTGKLTHRPKHRLSAEQQHIKLTRHLFLAASPALKKIRKTYLYQKFTNDIGSNL